MTAEKLFFRSFKKIKCSFLSGPLICIFNNKNKIFLIYESTHYEILTSDVIEINETNEFN